MRLASSAVVLLLAAAACSSRAASSPRGTVPPPGTPAPSAPSDAGGMPSPSPAASPPLATLVPAPAPANLADCVMITHDVEPIRLDVAALADEASVVVSAEVVGRAGDAMWNTPGGVRPKMSEVVPSGAELFTPYQVKHVDPLRGELTVDRVMLPGGGNGCDSEVYSGALLPARIDAGAYLFFLEPITDTAGSVLADAVATRAWRKDADGAFVDDRGNHVTRDEVVAVLAQHPKK